MVTWNNFIMRTRTERDADNFGQLYFQLTSFCAGINVVHRLFKPWRHFHVFLYKLRNVAFNDYIASDKASGILYFQIVTLMNNCK